LYAAEAFCKFWKMQMDLYLRFTYVNNAVGM